MTGTDSEPSYLSTTGETLLVWDTTGAPPPDGAWNVVLWRDFAAPGGAAFSIPKHLEQRAEILRARFLRWVQDLGETRIGGKTLLERLALRPGFSFWWLTLLAQKGNVYVSVQIVSVLKLMALEDWLGPAWCGRVVLASDDAVLARAFQLWCSNARIAFEWRYCEPDAARAPQRRRFFRLLPHPVQALLTLLFHLKLRWPLRRAGAEQLRVSQARVTFCSYLFNLDRTAADAGQLVSAFWGKLHSLLNAPPSRVNWLLMFIQHDVVPTTRRARQLIDGFNRQATPPHAYAAVDGALGWRVVARTLRDYIAVASAAVRMRSVRDAFRLAHSSIDLWPLFENDWRKSLLGSAAIVSCLDLNLLEATLRRLPRQRLGFYLQENIGWEMAFVHLWKAAGHGELIGVPHSTVRFWDLRYFFDPRAYRRTGVNDLPMPDRVALNGPAALHVYRAGGFPEEMLVEVEALRYLYLAEFARRDAAARRSSPRPLRVLVLGDYAASVTRQQMQWLATAAAVLPSDTVYVVKPHPACSIDVSLYPHLKVRLTSAPVEQLLGDCDVAYTSNITSAAVDAYIVGVPVVSVLDGDAFNLSPLRGMQGISFVTDPTELAQALMRAGELQQCNAEGYFCLDSGLPRWRRLLELPAGALGSAAN